MSLAAHKVFNPRDHLTDVRSAFTRFVRKFNYIYDAENRSVPTSQTTAEVIAN